jgi:hypothetical protein
LHGDTILRQNADLQKGNHILRTYLYSKFYVDIMPYLGKHPRPTK